MSETIQPFHRPAEARSVRDDRPRLVPLMLFHFALAGLVLLLAAGAVVGYLYALHFTHVDIGWNLRLSGADKIYDAETQRLFALVLILVALGLLQFGAFRTLSAGTAGALRAARAASVTLLAGFPLAVVIWRLELDLPGVPLSATQTATRVLAAILAAQALFALLYSVYLFLPGARRVIHRERFAAAPRLRRAGVMVLAVWIVALVAGGVALAVLTDLIELPVAVPQPGKLLYATSFEGDADAAEWDLYEGRDSAQIRAVELQPTPDGAPDRLEVRGQALVITYDSPITNEVVFSALDRKFTDMDLRVTARQLSGPDDNQFGVVFRYRDHNNYYAFFISGDGYYSLVKRKDGVLTDISTWGRSDAIAVGQAANAIRVVAQGDAFRFFVNGQPMPLCLPGENVYSMWNPVTGACVTSEPVLVFRDPDFSQGGVALAAGTSVDLSGAVVIAFDDLTIEGPAADVMDVDADRNDQGVQNGSSS